MDEVKQALNTNTRYIFFIPKGSEGQALSVYDFGFFPPFFQFCWTI